MRVKFWGVRGSVPTPGPATVRYGGNTPCFEVNTDGGTRLILEAGTGIRELGLALVHQSPINISIMISHTHWDHIQGFPFFGPIYFSGNVIDVYAPRPFGKPLEEVMALQMDPSYHPVRADQRPAVVRYHSLEEGTFIIGDAQITTLLMNHPVAALGYRIEAAGKSLAYTGDHEPYSVSTRVGGGHLRAPDPDDLAAASDQENARVVAFCRAADLLIADATYTPDEYETHVGWGHSSVEHTLDLAVYSDAKRLAMAHYDPLRTDDEVDQMVQRAQALMRERHPQGRVEVFASHEGYEVVL